MPLASELEDFFQDSNDVVVRDPLKFKAMLGIGERAYGLLRAREHMTTLSEALGVGATISSVAASGPVAGTFFASSSFMASALSTIGIGAAAATPIGWVIAAGVLSGGVYVGVSRIFERSKESGLIVVPKYINTPLDMIAVALIEQMLPVSIKIAYADANFHESEMATIHNYFSDEWGYSPRFVDRLVQEYSSQYESVSYSALADSLEKYCAESKDCDQEAIMAGFLAHLRKVIEADGRIHEQERQQLSYLASLLGNRAEQSGANSSVKATLNRAVAGISQGTTTLVNKGSEAANSSRKAFADIGSSERLKAVQRSAEEFLAESSHVGKSALENGRFLASEIRKSTSSKAQSIIKGFFGATIDTPED